MEAAEVRGKRGDGGVIDGVVEIVGADFAFVGDGDFGGGIEGHLEVGVEGLHGSDDKQRGLVDEVVAEHEAVEVTDGGFDGGGRLAVPPGAEDEILEVHVVIGVNGEPDVGDDAGTFDIEQCDGGAGIDGGEVGVAAGAIPTGGAAAFVVAQAGH